MAGREAKTYTRTAYTSLTEFQYRRLKRIAEDEGTNVGLLIRRAIIRAYDLPPSDLLPDAPVSIASP